MIKELVLTGRIHQVNKFTFIQITEEEVELSYFTSGWLPPVTKCRLQISIGS